MSEGRRRRRALRWIAYGVFLLVTLEIGARAALSIDPIFTRVRGDDGPSWRLRWVKRQTAGPSMYYSFDRFDPRLGWLSAPNLRNANVFGGKVLNTNSIGMRGRQEYALAAVPGRTRIMLLGDSFTFGDDVSDDETYAHYLQEMLPAAEVMNFGVHGYGHDQMLVLFRELGRRYRPDVVVVGFVRADMRRNLLAFRDYAKPRFVPAKDRLALRNVPVPDPATTLAREPFRSKLWDLLAMLRERVLDRIGQQERQARAVTVRILDALAGEVEAAGARPVLAYLPVMHEVDDPREEPTPSEQFLLEYCRTRGVVCTSVRPHFVRRVQAGATFSAGGHWSASGHRTVAEALSEFLRSARLVPDAPGCDRAGLGRARLPRRRYAAA